MSDNPRALATRARNAALILDAAADDGRPTPDTISIFPRVDMVEIRFNNPSDVYLWAQWRGVPDGDVTVRESVTGSGASTVEWYGEIYDQPVNVRSTRVLPETHDWDTPVREYPTASDRLPAQREATL